MKTKISNIIGWVFTFFVFSVGILNTILVSVILGFIYILLSLIYFPPTKTFLKNKYNFSIPVIIKILLGIFIFQFTLGVSDLGDMFDKLFIK